MEKYLYLFVNILTISFPLIRSFESKIQFAKKWYALMPAILLTAAFFIVWDHWFTLMGVWEFNPKYILGIYFFDLPIEEWMFFFTVPFACVFIYEVLHYFVPKDLLGGISTPITFILIPLFLGIGFLNLDKWYTSVTFILAAAALFLHFLMFRNKFMGRFYLTYLVHLIPFLVMNGILTGAFTEEPVVIYNNFENLAIRIYTIPVEDSVYSLILLLMNISIYEWIRSSKQLRSVKVIDL
jgi:lycopene cyclase domain-containing protein